MAARSQSRSRTAWRRAGCDRAGRPARALRRRAASSPRIGAEGYVLSLADARDDLRASPRCRSTCILGYGALVSFGHAAFLGIGAYAVGILIEPRHRRRCRSRSRRRSPPRRCSRSSTGAISLRTNGVYFIMITLAFGQMLFFLADLARRLWRRRRHDAARPQPRRRTRAARERPLRFYYVCLACLVGDLRCSAALIVASRFGRVLRGTRENPVRMEAIGFAPYRLPARRLRDRRRAWRARRLPAGQPDRVRQPRLHDLAALGRADHHGDPRRPRHAARRDPRRRGLPAARGVCCRALHRALEADLRRRCWCWSCCSPRGGLVVLSARGGSGLLPWLSRCLRLAASAQELRRAGRHRRRHLDVAPGELHAVIGPNGAGKTTLIHQISGTLRAGCRAHPASTGATSPRLPLHERGRGAGSRARSRSPRSCRGFSVLENVALAVQARSGSSFRFFGDAAARGGAERRRRMACARPGRPRPTAPLCRPGLLSHGEKRQLELAIALAMQPKLLLLDEPMAGTGPRGDASGVVATLRAAEAPLHHRAGRARHGGGVRARRPHLRAGLRPHHRHRRAGGDPRRRRGARRLSRRGRRG